MGNVELLREMSAHNRARAEALFSIQEMHRKLAEYYRLAAEGEAERWN